MIPYIDTHAEHTTERIEELERYLESFPNGIMAECARHELEALYANGEKYGF